jgi:hypothetical protein
VRFVWPQASRIVAGDSVQIREHAKEASHILRSSAMDDVEIHRGKGHPLQDRRHHTHADEFDSFVSEAEQYLVILRFDVVHDVSSRWRPGMPRPLSISRRE